MSALAEQYNAELVRRLQAEGALRSLAQVVESVLSADEAWSGESDDIGMLTITLSDLRRHMGWIRVRDAIGRANDNDEITSVKDAQDDGLTNTHTRPASPSTARTHTQNRHVRAIGGDTK